MTEIQPMSGLDMGKIIDEREAEGERYGVAPKLPSAAGAVGVGNG